MSTEVAHALVSQRQLRRIIRLTLACIVNIPNMIPNAIMGDSRKRRKISKVAMLHCHPSLAPVPQEGKLPIREEITWRTGH
jgi:hypothetical protein